MSAKTAYRTDQGIRTNVLQQSWHLRRLFHTGAALQTGSLISPPAFLACSMAEWIVVNLLSVETSAIDNQAYNSMLQHWTTANGRRTCPVGTSGLLQTSSMHARYDLLSLCASTMNPSKPKQVESLPGVSTCIEKTNALVTWVDESGLLRICVSSAS